MSSGYQQSPVAGGHRKHFGAYYTPHSLVRDLVAWGVRNAEDLLLDPACGDGRVLECHPNSVGVEKDVGAAEEASTRAPLARVYQDDFFSWASRTMLRFDCAVGNPPFIRYQTFSGTARSEALRFCAKLGAEFSGLTSSWAPFLVGAAALLKAGGRMAFVVPAEIGHAPYAVPALEFLISRFTMVHIVAVRQKLFPQLSADCWLLFADGFGGSTQKIRFSSLATIEDEGLPPRSFVNVSVKEWRSVWGRRLRPFLLTPEVRDMYVGVRSHGDSKRLGDIASVALGYVSGANDFFHLRPSDVKRWDIPNTFLQPSVRNGRLLPKGTLTSRDVREWESKNLAVLLLRIPKGQPLPSAVRQYLGRESGRLARQNLKCRVRDPWYAVPDIKVPDYFLTYMSGRGPNLVRNSAKCPCANSVHAIKLKSRASAIYLQSWTSPFVQLSCELEGHPLGGGMLKLEPGEASQIVLPYRSSSQALDSPCVLEALNTLRVWRHRASEL